MMLGVHCVNVQTMFLSVSTSNNSSLTGPRYQYNIYQDTFLVHETAIRRGFFKKNTLPDKMKDCVQKFNHTANSNVNNGLP